MKNVLLIGTAIMWATFGSAQEIVELPYEVPVDIQWTGGEKAYYSKIWDNPVVTNVPKPSMQVFRPKNPNGTSVIIAPGGGLYALSIESEGTAVAHWLSQKGITAFVLKYRLVPTGKDGVREISDLAANNPREIGKNAGKLLPYSIADGLAAITHVRQNAKKYAVDPNKIGFMGFSAGGAVTMGISYSYSQENRPDFVVPVYPWTTVYPPKEAPSDAPPMLVICATDDPLGLAAGSLELYGKWLEAQKPVGLHMYAKGGHGFGMKKQGLPSDDWIQRFYDWAIAEELVDVKTGS
ncbi:MAG: alpha/beta hydrolase [Bacteroidota bacterium]